MNTPSSGKDASRSEGAPERGNPQVSFVHSFASVLSQLQLAGDAASAAVSKLLRAAPRPHDAAGLTHATAGAIAAVSAACDFLGNFNSVARDIRHGLSELHGAVGALTAHCTAQELASPRGRRLSKFHGWKMLMALGQAGASLTCLIAGGLLVMRAWHEDGKIPKDEARNIIREAQFCQLSPEGLRALLEGDHDARDTCYPWLRQLQHRWPKLLNLFAEDGGGQPPRPPRFTDMARGQLLGSAEHASVSHRAGTPDHRHLSPGQFMHACQLVGGWLDADDWRGVFAEIGGKSPLTAELLGEIPLASPSLESWVVVIEDYLGCVQTDCSCIARDAAAAPTHGGVVPSSYVNTTFLSRKAVASLRARRRRFPNAKRLRELYPEAPALIGGMALYESRDEICPSWARWIPSYGLYMRRAGHDNFLSASNSNHFGHIPRSKMFYASASREEIWDAGNEFSIQIGLGELEPDKSSGVNFGCRVVPTMGRVREAGRWQLQKLREVLPGKNDSLGKLLEFHNRYVRVVGLRLAALLALRKTKCYELWADIDERVDLWVELIDKPVTGPEGALPVAICNYVRSMIRQYRSHCKAMARRIENMGCRDTVFHLWLQAVVEREREHLLCLASDVNHIRPAGSGDVIGRLPDDLALAPDFGRKLLENQMRRLTDRPAVDVRKFALRSGDIDAMLRHEVHGQWRFASSSDFILLEWLHRVIPTLDAIAIDVFGEVPNGLSKE